MALKRIFGAQLAAVQPQALSPIPATKDVLCSADTKKFGLENFGNTCYANSVIQALYFCAPFRDLIIQAQDPSNPPPPQLQPQLQLAPIRRKPAQDSPPTPIPTSPPTLFSALRSLFLHISTHPGEKGVVAPKAFIDKLKESKEDFRSTMHQDAHEFLNHLLNMIVEEIENGRKAAHSEDLSSSLATLSSKAPPTTITATSSNSGTAPQDATLVHKLFEGVLTSETRCLTCETVSSRDESFLDLSIDIEQNSSVTACLRSFSASEMLCQRNKFFCDSCCDLQEAEKRMKIKKLPNVLALHLKRFKFQEDVQKYIKLTYRVAFPYELRLFNTVDDLENADRLYTLFAIVVHIGNGPHHGHYISIVKSAGSWLVFDDDNVYPIPESDIPKYYGDSNSGSAYVLYYQAADVDPVSLGLQSPEPPVLPEPATQTTPPQSTLPFPPGLVAEAEATEVSENTTSSKPIPLPTTPNDDHFNKESSLPYPNGSTGLPLGAAQPISPSHNKFSPVRRTASSAVRPQTANSTSVSKSLPVESQRAPRPSASSPLLVVPKESIISPVPPLPPLAPSPPPPLVLPTEVKEKERAKKHWFRISLRMGGDKSKNGDKSKHSEDTSLSQSPREDRTGGSLKSFPQPRRRTSLATHELNAKKAELEPPLMILEPSNSSSTSGYTHTHSNSYSQSSGGPSIVLSSPATTIITSPSPPPALPPKPSIPKLNTKLNHTPPRSSSLVPTTYTRSGSMDQNRKYESRDGRDGKDGKGDNEVIRTKKTMARPSTVSGSLPSPSQNRSGTRELPPLPLPLPNGQQQQHQYQERQRQQYFFSEPEPEPESTTSVYPPGFDGSVNTLSEVHSSTTTTTSSTNINTTHLNGNGGGGGMSGSFGSSGNSPFKRATRKLSMTAPMLGFGRKDKEKEKEKEKDRTKDKVPPTLFMNMNFS